MVLKVDLQCEKCYRKVKKVLCKFPRESLFFSLSILFNFCVYNEREKRKLMGDLWYYLLDFVNKRNTRPDVRREEQPGDNQSGLLQS